MKNEVSMKICKFYFMHHHVTALHKLCLTLSLGQLQVFTILKLNSDFVSNTSKIRLPGTLKRRKTTIDYRGFILS